MLYFHIFASNVFSVCMFPTFLQKKIITSTVLHYITLTVLHYLFLVPNICTLNRVIKSSQDPLTIIKPMNAVFYNTDVKDKNVSSYYQLPPLYFLIWGSSEHSDDRIQQLQFVMQSHFIYLLNKHSHMAGSLLVFENI